MPYDPTAPMIERLAALRGAIKRDTCGHDWVHVQGATICANCGADLEKMLDEYRTLADDGASGFRRPVYVTLKAEPQPEPEPDALRGLVYMLAGVAGVLGGLLVARMLS